MAKIQPLNAKSTRDPARIDDILEQLRRAWIYQPDTRLTQLLVNVANTGEVTPKLYHMEDDKLLDKLEKEAKRQASLYLAKGNDNE